MLPPPVGQLARRSGEAVNDSGVSHLASAVGIPSVVVFVAANLRWRPWARARPVLVDTTRVRSEDAAEVADTLAEVLTVSA